MGVFEGTSGLVSPLPVVCGCAIAPVMKSAAARAFRRCILACVVERLMMCGSEIRSYMLLRDDVLEFVCVTIFVCAEVTASASHSQCYRKVRAFDRDDFTCTRQWDEELLPIGT